MPRKNPFAVAEIRRVTSNQSRLITELKRKLEDRRDEFKESFANHEALRKESKSSELSKDKFNESSEMYAGYLKQKSAVRTFQRQITEAKGEYSRIKQETAGELQRLQSIVTHLTSEYDQSRLQLGTFERGLIDNFKKPGVKPPTIDEVLRTMERGGKTAELLSAEQGLQELRSICDEKLIKMVQKFDDRADRARPLEIPFSNFMTEAGDPMSMGLMLADTERHRRPMVTIGGDSVIVDPFWMDQVTKKLEERAARNRARGGIYDTARSGGFPFP